MSKQIDAVKKLLADVREEPAQPRRRDPDFVGRSSVKEIENASPERQASSPVTRSSGSKLDRPPDAVIDAVADQ
jgi:hypothetical protein